MSSMVKKGQEGARKREQERMGCLLITVDIYAKLHKRDLTPVYSASNYLKKVDRFSSLLCLDKPLAVLLCKSY